MWSSNSRAQIVTSTPVPVAARVRERLRDRRLGDAEQPQHAAARHDAPARAEAASARLAEPAATAPAARAAGPGSATATLSPSGEDDGRAVPTSPTHSAPSGSVACLRTPGAKSAYGRSSRVATERDSSSIAASSSSSTCSPTPAAWASSSIVRSSCVGPSPPETTSRSCASPARSAGSRSPGRRRRSRSRPGRRRAARRSAREDTARSGPTGRRARAPSPTPTIAARTPVVSAACQPVFVTMPTRGCAPGTRDEVAGDLDREVLRRVDLHPEPRAR